MEVCKRKIRIVGLQKISGEGEVTNFQHQEFFFDIRHELLAHVCRMGCFWFDNKAKFFLEHQDFL